MLYLREAEPAGGSAHPRVNSGAFDLGSCSAEPPAQPELRQCGDVIVWRLQGATHGQPVDQVMIRLRWWSPLGRTRLSLWSPSRRAVVAATSLEACTGPDDGIAEGPVKRQCHRGWTSTVLRLHLSPPLEPAELDDLHLVADASGAWIHGATSPGDRSWMALNPPTEAQLARLDSDGDGSSDADELAAGADPWDPQPQATGGLAWRAWPEPPPPAPTVDRWLEPMAADAVLRVGAGEVVGTRGRVRLAGSLELAGGTLVLARGEDGAMAELSLPAGTSLSATAGARIVAGDPADGFSLRAEPGSRLVLDHAQLDRPGVIRHRQDGRAITWPVWVSTDDTVLHDLQLRGAATGLSFDGGSHVLERARFSQDGTAVQLTGGMLTVRDSRSDHDTIFAEVRSGGVLVVEDSTVQSARESAVLCRDAQQVLLRGSDLHARGGVVDRIAECGLQASDTVIRGCPGTPTPSQGLPGVTWQPAPPEACKRDW